MLDRRTRCVCYVFNFVYTSRYCAEIALIHFHDLTLVEDFASFSFGTRKVLFLFVPVCQSQPVPCLLYIYIYIFMS
ncbi:uncharacterized protein EDB93DRAFT_1120891 [Suillus bovinus]|uniref:uncharacterized protein n=1 Tax=Suillus bovinus TaxID=48563 RepID=UPI001B86F45E|nr:uncharacterized protein EDB93DRAFT_1120891 [Suillus bovinus]KAG2158328.1 hypothetical protein EDB93DRAFT_1120891 [Suillus bovinus]